MLQVDQLLQSMEPMLREWRENEETPIVLKLTVCAQLYSEDPGNAFLRIPENAHWPPPAPLLPLRVLALRALARGRQEASQAEFLAAQDHAASLTPGQRRQHHETGEHGYEDAPPPREWSTAESAAHDAVVQEFSEANRDSRSWWMLSDGTLVHRASVRLAMQCSRAEKDNRTPVDREERTKVARAMRDFLCARSACQHSLATTRGALLACARVAAAVASRADGAATECKEADFKWYEFTERHFSGLPAERAVAIVQEVDRRRAHLTTARDSAAAYLAGGSLLDPSLPRDAVSFARERASQGYFEAGDTDDEREQSGEVAGKDRMWQTGSGASRCEGLWVDCSEVDDGFPLMNSLHPDGGPYAWSLSLALAEPWVVAESSYRAAAWTGAFMDRHGLVPPPSSTPDSAPNVLQPLVARLKEQVRLIKEEHFDTPRKPLRLRVEPATCMLVVHMPSWAARGDAATLDFRVESPEWGVHLKKQHESFCTALACELDRRWALHPQRGSSSWGMGPDGWSLLGCQAPPYVVGAYGTEAVRQRAEWRTARADVRRLIEEALGAVSAEVGSVVVQLMYEPGTR